MEVEASSDVAHTSVRHSFLDTLYKLISASLYILDFGTNIYTAHQYYAFDITYKATSFEGINQDNKNEPGIGIFVAMVSVMAVGHISCGIVFKLVDLPGVKHRMRLGYFLPFAQLGRALRTLFNCSSNGHRLTPGEEARIEALYALVSATTDGGPLFLLQYLALAEYTTVYFKDSPPWTPAPLLIISLCLSAVSATWNITRAIVFLIPLPSKRLALAAGAFSLSALSVRCATLVSLLTIRALPQNLSTHQFLVMLGIYLPLILVVPFIGNFFLTRREGTSEFSCRSIANSTLRAVGFTYVSLSFGPLYPLVSVAQTKRVSTKRFQNRLLFQVAYRFVVEATIMTFLVKKKWSPCVVLNFEEYPEWAPGYYLCLMMPCSLYIATLAAGLAVGVISTVAFMIFLAGVSLPGYIGDFESADAVVNSLGLTVDIMNLSSNCCS